MGDSPTLCRLPRRLRPPLLERVPAAGLTAAYLSTTYRVDAPCGPIALRVGQRSRALDGILRRRGRRTWAFITACNPRSQRLPGWRNLARQRRLQALVEQLGYSTLAGSGTNS